MNYALNYFLRILLLVCTLVASRAPLAQPPNFCPYPTNLTAHATLSSAAVDKIQVGFFESKICRLAMSKARVYAEINVVRPRDYWDYESLTVHWG